MVHREQGSLPRGIVMKMTLLKSSLLASLLMLASASLNAQDLTLFESVGTDGPVERPDGLQGREQRNLPSTPSFTLVGTSRIGGKQRATLMSSSGEIVTVDTTPGAVQEIPDHPGFRVVEIAPRRVVIANPSDTPCIAASDRGVSCDANGASRLTLATAAPLPVTAAVASVDGNGAPVNGDPAGQPVNGDVPPDNPFAAALRAAAANEANANAANGQPQAATAAERFQPRRIGPDEVPPGMRVVRTPFGDRLVELRQ